MKKKIILIAVSCIIVIITILYLNSESAKGTKALSTERIEKEQDSIAQIQKIKDSIAIDSIMQANTEKEKRKTEIIGRCKNLFRIKKDEFSDNAWVEPAGAPKYRNQNGVYCYFASKDGEAPSNFRFVYQYCAEDWLFIESMIFNIDGDNIRISPDMERDCGNGGKIWEWCDESVNYSISGINEEFIRRIANAKTVKVKMNGSQYYDTRTLSAAQIKSIKDTYEYYLALGGKFNK